MGARHQCNLLNTKRPHGYDLGTVDGQLTAYIELEDEVEFILSIERDSALTRVVYAIVD
jgi:hypothetical protein